jgi:hypothetical protein
VQSAKGHRECGPNDSYAHLEQTRSTSRRQSLCGSPTHPSEPRPACARTHTNHCCEPLYGHEPVSCCNHPSSCYRAFCDRSVGSKKRSFQIVHRDPATGSTAHIPRAVATLNPLCQWPVSIYSVHPFSVPKSELSCDGRSRSLLFSSTRSPFPYISRLKTAFLNNPFHPLPQKYQRLQHVA